MWELLLIGLLLWQDKPEPEKILVAVPSFYYTFSVETYSGSQGKLFLKPPKNANRRYFLQKIVDLNQPDGEPQEVTEEKFYTLMSAILSYGVRDSAYLDTAPLNEGFRNLVKYLLGKEIITLQQMRNLAGKFTEAKWFESLYWLDEAVPGVFTANVKDLVAVDYSTGGVYFTALAALKLHPNNQTRLNEVRDSIDERLGSIMTSAFQSSSTLFPTYACAYAEFIKHGVEMTEKSQIKLIELYFDYLTGYDNENGLEGVHQGISKIYTQLSLPLPSKPTVIQVFTTALIGRLKTASEPNLKLVADFRVFKLAFPKEYAKTYRDILLANFGTGSYEDIEYLVGVTGDEDVAAEIWRRYGDQALDWHFSASRKNHNDSSDYAHAAIECYRKLWPLVEKLEKEKSDLLGKKNRSPADEDRLQELQKKLRVASVNPERIKKIAAAYDDLSIRMTDLLYAHELAGFNPRDELFFAKIEKRVENYNRLPAGVYLRERTPVYRTNEYGQRLIPFRDEIELACYLKDEKLAKALAIRIADRAIGDLQLEGEAIFQEYREKRCETPVEFAGYEERLRGAQTPAFKSLEMVLDHYERLQFRAGIRSLAQALYDCGLLIHAQRAFRLAGLEAEANAKFYRRFTEDQLAERQRELNLRIRSQRAFGNPNK